MHRRLWLFIAVLVLASLACTLGSRNESNNTVPTPIPTTVVIAASPTSQPSITPAPTASPRPTNTPVPNCTPRRDWPTIVVQPGDTLFGIGLQVGATVEQLVAANCLASADTIYVGQALYVPSVPPPPPPITPIPTCPNPWFFVFDAGLRRDTDTCPKPVVALSAFGQDFEGGRVYVYAPMPGSTDGRGTVYVIYNSGIWQTFPDTWQIGQPESDPALVPPSGRYQPVQSIGKVWRDNPLVRQELGWALEPQTPFTGRFQEPSGAPDIFLNRVPYFYVDHGKWGIVLRLYAVNMGPNTWEVAGRY